MTKKKIYVVDDERDVCELIKITLESRGMLVEYEHNGEKGLDLLKRSVPDLLITDLKMPRMNGYEFITTIKQNPKFKDLPIIVITSLTQDSVEGDSHWRDALEVNEFITKPFIPQDLAKTVENLLCANKA